jgi:hypothetical protein
MTLADRRVWQEFVEFQSPTLNAAQRLVSESIHEWLDMPSANDKMIAPPGFSADLRWRTYNPIVFSYFLSSDFPTFAVRLSNRQEACDALAFLSLGPTI